ncbi:MAG: hypothetical protein LBV12_05075 [Puniceicoccales bacterium]|jgi:hypothetical protein|nr:hypothetical protein [Puniceicoccales bacterium]
MNYKTAIALFCVTSLLGASAAFAQENRDDRRERRFRQDRGREAPERASFAPLELHGMIGSGDNMEVSITNPQTNESQWVKVRDKTAKWYVESANPAARSVVVQMNGMAVKLEMIRNTGEPMSIAPQPMALSADQAAAEAARGNTIGGLNPKEIAARMAAMRTSGERPSREEMEAFGKQVQALTPEQRTQFFSEMRSEMQKAGVDFGAPPRDRSNNSGQQGNAAAATTATTNSNSGQRSWSGRTQQSNTGSSGAATPSNSSGGSSRGNRGGGGGGRGR